MVFSDEANYKSINSYKSSMGDIKHQISLIKNENSRYMALMQQLRRDIDNLTKDKSRANEKVATLEDECNTLQESNQQLQLNLKKGEKENCISCERICFLEAELNSNSHEKFELNKNLEALQYELKHYEQNYHTCFKERSTAIERCANIEKELTQKISEYENILKEKKEKEKELLLQITESETNSNDLTTILDHCQDSCADKEDQIKVLKDDIASLSAKCCKLRVNKKKYKAISQRLEDLNTVNEKKLEKMDSLRAKVAGQEKSLVELNADLKHLKHRFEEQTKKLQQLKEERETLRESNTILEENEKHMHESNAELNKSIGSLENNNEEKTLHIKCLENDTKKKTMLYEVTNQKLVNTIKKIEQDLNMTRCELKERRKEVSELKQENLEKDFRIQEIERASQEKDVLIKVRGKEEQLLLEKNQILTTEIEIMKVKQKMKTRAEEEKAKNEVNESTTIIKLMQELKVKREERMKYNDQQNTIEKQSEQIDELGRQLKSEETNHKKEFIEKLCLKDQLDRITTTNMKAKLYSGH